MAVGPTRAFAAANLALSDRFAGHGVGPQMSRMFANMPSPAAPSFETPPVPTAYVSSGTVSFTGETVGVRFTDGAPPGWSTLPLLLHVRAIASGLGAATSLLITSGGRPLSPASVVVGGEAVAAVIVAAYGADISPTGKAFDVRAVGAASGSVRLEGHCWPVNPR